jgi:hypothetical protein
VCRSSFIVIASSPWHRIRPIEPDSAINYAARTSGSSPIPRVLFSSPDRRRARLRDVPPAEMARRIQAMSCDTDNREISRKTAPANGATNRCHSTGLNAG